MSEFYEDSHDDNICEDTNVNESKPIKKERYRSYKDQTKRREQALANLAKGRAKRLENLANKNKQPIKQVKSEEKHEVEYEYEDNSSEELVLTKKKKSKPIPIPKSIPKQKHDERLDRLEALLMKTVEHKKKVKKEVEPTVPEPKPMNPVLQHIKQKLLDL
jgi:hypothetical protein